MGFVKQERTKCLNLSIILLDDQKCNVVFDIWVPEHKIALEYQGIEQDFEPFFKIPTSSYLGEHHYYDIHSGFSGTSELFSIRDTKKKKICDQNGIVLLCIPY